MMTDPNHPRLLKSAFHLITILLFFAAIMLPAAGHISGRFDVNYIRETEKRNPNELPDFPGTLEKLKTYPGQLNAYLNDHFGFRSWLVSMNSMMMLKMGSSASPKVIAGKDGWLFYKEDKMVEQHRGIRLYTEQERQSWIEVMKERKEWLAARGIPFIIAVPPNKMTIYPKYLPKWVRKVSSVTQIDQLVASPDLPGLDLVDLRKPVREAQKNAFVYYQTDSHWNFFGGFAGYRAIMKSVQHYFPEVQPLTPEDVDIIHIESVGMDLCNMLNIVNVKKEPYAYRVSLKKPTEVLSETQDGEAYFPRIVKTKAANGLRVLIYRDSFTINMEPFLNETFTEIIYALNQHKFNAALVEKYQPDLVLLIMIERALSYRPYNPRGVGDGKLRICNWGPEKVRLGEKFNVNGDMSAFWIIAANISDKTYIMWNGKMLETVRDLERDTLSALVPDAYYAEPGKHEIKLFDAARNVYSDSVYFTVDN